MRAGYSMHDTYKKEAGIYFFTNKINGKVYVGETMNIRKRMGDHRGVYNKCPFSRAIKKYGFDGFDLKIMYFPVITKKELLDLEETFIFLESSLVTEHGYNICVRGTDRTGVKASAETLRNMSKSMTGDKHPMYGKKRPEMSSRQMGKGNAMYGKTGDNSPFYGIKKTEEHRKKIGDSKRGEKSIWFGMFGDKHPNSKKVEQYDKDYNFIKEYSCAREAMRELLISNTNISACARGRVKSAGGFIWKYSSN